MTPTGGPAMDLLGAHSTPRPPAVFEAPCNIWVGLPTDFTKCLENAIFPEFLAVFDPLTSQKIKILKTRKMPGDIIILHKCTTNDNAMYGSSDMKHKAQQTGFFVLLPH